MTDYGHPLRFGTFITPGHTPATGPVDLAVLSEELGFDLVTFQDHPYQPGFQDTWTLLTWVAARTSRVTVAGNVLNLPLRNPAVLARSSASLDLLSGGRFALGLGSGAFWEAIAAMGGQQLTPGQGVTALGEALDIIRGIWDAGDRSPLRVEGEHHRVNGAKRGPAPAHAIPIWLGALKPRMLRLTAEEADGWLPSLSYLKPGDLTAGNKSIDEHAEAAGRDPREIVRLLNVTSDLDASDLVALAVNEGVSTFILAADSAGQLQHWATEVMPAVRDGVARSRQSHGIAEITQLRSRAALAKRKPGIAYDAVPSSLVAEAVEPGDHGYPRYTSSYLRGGAPGLILRPQTMAQVRDAVQFAATQREVPLGIFSAGHGISGRSLNRGGIVIDVGALNTIELLGDTRVRVGPGARWVDVARALAPAGLAISSGDYGGVGVGGLATAGGIGWMAREHGLTIDHLRSVDVVTAAGDLVHASAAENPDLFWAVRGAGANMGVVVSFEFEAVKVGTIAFAQLVFDASDTSGLLQRWGQAMEAADRSVSGELILGARRSAQPYLAQAMLMVNSDDPDTVIERLQPIADIAPLRDQSVAMAQYHQVIGAFVDESGQRGTGEPRSHSGLIEHLTPQFAAQADQMLTSGATYFFQIRSVGGATSDVPADATAYAWRKANFSVVAMGTGASGLDAAWERLLPHLEGSYLNFETDTGPQALTRAFPPGHLDRLRDIKTDWDPTGLFRDNFFIAPHAPEQP
ncbi:MAG: LLM class flavin-dependent oxidoreductase [Beutenbergiaceae bacterium]